MSNILDNSNTNTYVYISAFIALATVSAATKVPKWENLECEVKLSWIYLFRYFIIWFLLSSGGSQVPVLGHDPQLGRGSGRVRAVRRLAGQHWRGEGAELPHEVWSLQDRAGGQVVLDWG